MKRLFLALLLISSFILTVIASAEEADMKTIKEIFLEKAGISNENIPEADLDVFLEEKQINQYLLEIIPQDVIMAYAQHLIDGEPISYKYLLEENNSFLPLGIDYYNDLCRLALISPNDATCSSLLVDFDIERMYFSPHKSIIDDVCLSTINRSLSSNSKGQFIEALIAANLETWQYSYGKQIDGQRSEPWVLILEFGNGTIVHYTITGVDKDAPTDKMQILTQSLFSLAIDER